MKIKNKKNNLKVLRILLIVTVLFFAIGTVQAQWFCNCLNDDDCDSVNAPICRFDISCIPLSHGLEGGRCGCSTNDDCGSPDFPYCMDRGNGVYRCVECLEDGHCDDPLLPTCRDGVCRADVNEIDSCQTIEEEGYYGLTKDISTQGTCFTINSNNVVIDCQNHQITGDGSGSGILISNSESVIVINCEIKNFNQGIYIFGGSNNRLLENNISDNINHNIYLLETKNNNIRNNIITNSVNDTGLFFEDSNNSNIIDNDFDNCEFGMRFMNSEDNTIRNNKILNSREWDIYVETLSENNIFENLRIGKGASETIISFEYTGLIKLRYPENIDVSEGLFHMGYFVEAKALSSDPDQITAMDYIIPMATDYIIPRINLTIYYYSDDVEYVNEDNLRMWVKDTRQELGWRLLGDSRVTILPHVRYVNSGNKLLSISESTIFAPMIGPIEIDSCEVINIPGEYYIGKNIEGLLDNEDFCIKIDSDEVILHCNDNSLIGNRQGKGIYFGDSENSIVVNCNIDSYDKGIYMSQNASENLIENNVLLYNRYGMFLNYSGKDNKNNIQNNVIYDSNSEWAFYSEGDSEEEILNLTVGSTSENATISFKSLDIALRNSLERPIMPIDIDFIDCGIGNLILSKHKACGADPMEALFNNTDVDSGTFNLTYRTYGVEISIPYYIRAINNSENSWLNLNISYTEEDISEEVSEEELQMWVYKEENWEELPNSGVNTEKKYVYSGQISDFSIFAPIGTGIPTIIDEGVFCFQDQNFEVLNNKAYCDFFLPFYRRNALILLNGTILDDNGNYITSDNNCIQYTYMEPRRMCYDWTGRQMYDCDSICDDTLPDKRYRNVLTVPIPLHFTFGIKSGTEIEGICPESDPNNIKEYFKYDWSLEVDMVTTIMADDEIIPVLVGEDQRIDEGETICSGEGNLCYTEVPVCNDFTCDYELGENCWNCPDDCGDEAEAEGRIDSDEFEGSCIDFGCAEGCDRYNYLDRDFLDERGCIIKYKQEEEFTYCPHLCEPDLVANEDFFGQGNTFLERLRDRSIEGSKNENVEGRYVCCPPNKMFHEEYGCITKRGFKVDKLDIYFVEPGDVVGVCCYDEWLFERDYTNIWARVDVKVESDNSLIDSFNLIAQFNSSLLLVQDHNPFEFYVYGDPRESHTITRSGNIVPEGENAEIEIFNMDWACLTRMPISIAGGPSHMYNLWYTVCNDSENNFLTIDIEFDIPCWFHNQELANDFSSRQEWLKYVSEHYQHGEMYCDLVAQRCYIEEDGELLYVLGHGKLTGYLGESPTNIASIGSVFCGGVSNPSMGGSDGCSLGLSRFINRCADCDPIAAQLDGQLDCTSKKLITGGLVGRAIGWDGIGTIECKRK